MQDCSNSIANALELLRSCAKSSISSTYPFRSRSRGVRGLGSAQTHLPHGSHWHRRQRPGNTKDIVACELSLWLCSLSMKYMVMILLKLTHRRQTAFTPCSKFQEPAFCQRNEHVCQICSNILNIIDGYDEDLVLTLRHLVFPQMKIVLYVLGCSLSHITSYFVILFSFNFKMTIVDRNVLPQILANTFQLL